MLGLAYKGRGESWYEKAAFQVEVEGLQRGPLIHSWGSENPLQSFADLFIFRKYERLEELCQIGWSTMQAIGDRS